MSMRSVFVSPDAPIMNSRPLWIVTVAVTLVAAFGGLSGAARAQPAGNAVTQWNLIATNTLVQFPGPAGGAPPALQVHMGMVQGAVYDAVNAIEPRHRRPYLLESRFASTAST